MICDGWDCKKAAFKTCLLEYEDIHCDIESCKRNFCKECWNESRLCPTCCGFIVTFTFEWKRLSTSWFQNEVAPLPHDCITIINDYYKEDCSAKTFDAGLNEKIWNAELLPAFWRSWNVRVHLKFKYDDIHAFSAQFETHSEQFLSGLTSWLDETTHGPRYFGIASMQVAQNEILYLRVKLAQKKRKLDLLQEEFECNSGFVRWEKHETGSIKK